MPHSFGGFEPRSGPFSSGRTQYRGQNFVHLSGEISLFPKEISSNTALGLPAEGLAEASASPQSCSEAAYRCNPGTAAWAAGRGGCEPQPICIAACLLQSLRRALPRPTPLVPAALCPRLPLLCPGAVWKGSWEPSEAPQTRVWKRVGRGRGFPSNLRPAWLRESFSKFPAAPAQVASAGRADGGQRASLAAAASRALWATLSLASLLAGSRPGSRRAGPPPGAKAAADAGGSEGGSCPAPTAQAAPQGLHLGPRRAARGARPEVPEGAVRAGGPGRLSGLARPRATETFRSSPRPTPYPPPAWPKAPEGGGLRWAPRRLRVPARP
ncbi:translation initiation factor IF-2-like [Orcinus orca]|uniref:translation initiation factor IF-2-like n=1 Tax=Orcinus orca TaxID=9733 RepID=UPI0021138CB6|nr:translation initiation factor IF-2-like [Orcinus orca]